MKNKTQKTKSKFTEFFGNRPQVRVVSIFLDNKKAELSITELIEKANVSRPTMYKIVKALCNVQIIERTRKIGVTPMYHLQDNNLIKCLSDLKKGLD